MSAQSAESLLVSALAAALPGVPVRAEVPSERPGVLVTVERVGGPRTLHLDRGTYAVQCWAAPTSGASGRAAAARLCERVVSAILSLPCSHPRVAATDVVSSYNFPDPDSGHSRYQITASVVVMSA